MEKKVFELVIDDEQDSGVNMIALVDSPAIMRDFLKFNKEQKADYKFAVTNEDKRIVSGFAMVADLPIERLDDDGVGTHFVVFRKDTIEAIVDKFMRSNFNSNINIMHENPIEGVTVIESLIMDEARGIFPPEGFEDAPDGSWWVSMRVDNDEVWQQVKDGTFKGFSVEGMFNKLEPELKDEDIIQAAVDALAAEF